MEGKRSNSRSSSEERDHKSHSHHHHHHRHHHHHSKHGKRDSRSKLNKRSKQIRTRKTKLAEKKSRTRSANPLLANYGNLPDKIYDQKLFWDGFQWVTRITPLITSFEQTVSTKKAVVSNIPLELGLSAQDIKRQFNKLLNDVYKSPEIIKNVELIPAQNAAAIEVAVKEDLPKVKSLDAIKFLGNSLTVTSFEDKTINFNVTDGASKSLANPVANSAQTAAQASAIAAAALKSLQGQDATFTLIGDIKKASKIVKLSNIIDPIEIYRMGDEILEIQMDMKEELMMYGTINTLKMIMPGQQLLGAEVGSIFCVYEIEKSASEAVHKLNGRKYDNRKIAIVFVKSELYNEQFKDVGQSFIDLQLDQPV